MNQKNISPSSELDRRRANAQRMALWLSALTIIIFLSFFWMVGADR